MASAIPTQPNWEDRLDLCIDRDSEGTVKTLTALSRNHFDPFWVLKKLIPESFFYSEWLNSGTEITAKGASFVVKARLKETIDPFFFESCTSLSEMKTHFLKFIESKNRFGCLIIHHFYTHLIPVFFQKTPDKIDLLITDSLGDTSYYSRELFQGLIESFEDCDSSLKLEIYAFKPCRQHDGTSCGAFTIDDTIKFFRLGSLDCILDQKIETFCSTFKVKDKNLLIPINWVVTLPFPFCKLIQSVTVLNPILDKQKESDIDRFRSKYFHKTSQNKWVNSCARYKHLKYLAQIIVEIRKSVLPAVLTQTKKTFLESLYD